MCGPLSLVKSKARAIFLASANSSGCIPEGQPKDTKGTEEPTLGLSPNPTYVHHVLSTHRT